MEYQTFAEFLSIIWENRNLVVLVIFYTLVNNIAKITAFLKALTSKCCLLWGNNLILLSHDRISASGFSDRRGSQHKLEHGKS